MANFPSTTFAARGPDTGFAPDCGVVVVGHGTADATGAAETAEVAALVAALLPGVPVELGFLEVIEPSIAVAVNRLAARGCRRLVAAPLLLFAAGHARRDVPEALGAAVAAAGVVARQSEPLGLHDAVVELSARRRVEALAGVGPVAAADTVLAVLGRGASDPGALGRLQEFARATLAVAGDWRPGRIEYGFAAAARPTLDEALAAAAAAGPRRVVVQPHLLFHGHVEDQVSAAVARAREAWPAIEWVQVSRLGADVAVARALVDRVRATAADAGDGRVPAE
jgi:sirohydrochlorin cobaltochelatase